MAPGSRPGSGEGRFMSRAGPSNCASQMPPNRPGIDQALPSGRNGVQGRGYYESDRGFKALPCAVHLRGRAWRHHQAKSPLRGQATMQVSGHKAAPIWPRSTGSNPPQATPHRLATFSAAPGPIIALSSARGARSEADHDGPRPPARLLASQPRQKPRLLITPRTTRRWPDFARRWVVCCLQGSVGL
jgi:hypothetical protein